MLHTIVVTSLLISCLVFADGSLAFEKGGRTAQNATR